MAQLMLRDYLQETEDSIAAKRFDEALERCQHVLNQFPESLEAQRLLGEIYLAQGHLEEAQQIFDWVLTNDPENVVVYCDRALISERISDIDTALDCYQQAYELSHGNGQIRLEFNQLSARSSQPGFMFSRAGLARLYMRGDLLEQAIQEWDAVLTTTPDRLDARVGLLEACWQAGVYERAEQVARQVLQDVPGCLKALILLAFMTLTKNASEAQELIKRAEVLDPELLIAQDLFTDLRASQSNHPFLKLLNKESVTITIPDSTSVPASSNVPVAVPSGANASAGSAAEENLAHWRNVDYWNGIDTLDNPHLPEPQPVAEGARAPFSFEEWEHAESSNPWEKLTKLPDQPTGGIPELSASSMLSQSATARDEVGAVDQSAQQEQSSNYAFDAWSSSRWSSPVQPDHAESMVPEPVKEDADQPAEPALAHLDTWSLGSNAMPEEHSWQSFSSGEGTRTESAPPSWLNMLSQQESPAQPAAPVQDKESAKPAEPIAFASTQQSASNVPSHEKEEKPVKKVQVEQEEGFSFGPEWLRALGAASFGGISADIGELALSEPASLSSESRAAHEEQPASAQETNTFEQWQSPQPKAQPTYEAWTAPAAKQESTFEDWTSSVAKQEPTYEAWTAPAAKQEEPAEAPWQAQHIEPLPDSSFSAWSTTTHADPVAPAEQSFLSALQHLESDLHSRGFVPLEPNSLSSIAEQQGQETSQTSQEGDQSEQEVSLSSALAELSNLKQRKQTANPHVEPSWLQELTPQSEPAVETPSWMASLGTTPTPAPTPMPQEQPFVRRTTRPLQPAASAQPEESKAVWTPPQAPQTPPVRVDALPGPVYTPAPEPLSSPKRQPEPVKVPVAREPVGSDFELEATMKRPAVRLQAVQRPVTANVDRLATGPKQRAVEPPAASKARDGGGNYRERLVNGYQHQLVGDYDEAMQEYRIIIRNAPELLSEVVSNVRALLKLAPKYATGYRVLGDAYMRQGEYLQAMEAYNKALTMAKKARG